jgi:hypothetical protein
MKTAVLSRLADLERLAGQATAAVQALPDDSPAALLACKLAVAADHAAAELQRLLDDLQARHRQAIEAAR